MEGSRHDRNGPRVGRRPVGNIENRRKKRMDMAELEKKGCSILADNLSAPEDKVTPDSGVQEAPGADPLGLVQAVLALGEGVGPQSPEEQWEGGKPVGSASR